VFLTEFTSPYISFPGHSFTADKKLFPVYHNVQQGRATKTFFHHFLKTKIKYFSSIQEENFYIILSKYFQHDEPKNISSL